MKIHEFQAKELLRRFGVPVPPGEVARFPEEAGRIASDLGGRVVVKAQIHAGGRGKGGGVHMAHDARSAVNAATAILGMQLVTPQTRPGGQRVQRVLVEAASDIARELYVGVTLDRARGQMVLMASERGGMEIEEVTARDPKSIIVEPIDPAFGLRPFQASRLAFALGLGGTHARPAARLLQNLCRAYVSADCALLEINPLVVTADGSLLALDAKVNLDDNALHRHADLAAWRDLDEEDPLEVEATRSHLNYVKLDGSIGCMVNGAGLAMATMDIIKLAGGEPANFLDVGGGASAETVENGFRILLSDPQVRAVLVNIFGGIVRCDRVAAGVIQARSKLQVGVPVVVRLAGTNAEEAALMLKRSGHSFVVASGLADAAAKAVAASQQGTVTA